jgi:hypothetical protein
MIALQGSQFIELIKLLANQANTFLLTINSSGAVRSAIVSCTTCKKDGHTTVTSDKCWLCAETKLRHAVMHVAEAEMILKTEIKPRDAKMILKSKKPTTIPFGSRQKPRSGNDCGIRVSSRNGSAETF